MRRLIGLAAMPVTALVAAQPACAADSALGLTQLIVSTGIAPATPVTVTTPQMPAFSLASVAGGAAQAAQPDFRLHALMPMTAAQPAASIDGQTARLRRGVGGAMADFFPLGVDGFHVSGGARFYSRGPARAGVVDAHGLVDMRYVTLLASPRSLFARTGRRMSPALALGYTRLLQGGMSLGIEGGAMLGKFDSLAGSLIRVPRLRGAGAGDGFGRISQVARVTFGYRF